MGHQISAGCMGKTSHFLALNVNISKTVGDTSKLLLGLMSNRKSYMDFRLTSRSMTLDDLELYKLEFSDNFYGRAVLSHTTLMIDDSTTKKYSSAR